MADILLDLAEVNLNLNNKVRKNIEKDFDKIKSCSTPYGELGELIYHLFETINIWLNRITNLNEKIVEYNELSNKEQFYSEWIKADERFLFFAKKNHLNLNYSQIVKYTNRNGIKEEFLLKDLILHISHHSFYHRGQIATLLRINKFDPLPDLDWSKD